MRLPEIEKLHEEAVRRIQDMQDGNGPEGWFGAILEAAQWSAIDRVCAAIRRDFQHIASPHNATKAGEG